MAFSPRRPLPARKSNFVKSDIPGTFKMKDGTYRVNEFGAIANGIVSDVQKLRSFLKNSVKNKSRSPSMRGVPSYKKGGIVKKTGLAVLHKGERVIPKKKKSKKY